MASKLPTVAIIGQANVGKSSLFNRLVRSRQAIVAAEAGTTRDNVIGKVTYRRTKVNEPLAASFSETSAALSGADEYSTTVRREAVLENDGSEEANWSSRRDMARYETDNAAEFWLVDTAGLKDPADEFEASIQDQIDEAADTADVILVVVDSTQYPSDDDRLVAKKALKSKKPVLLVANKVDLKGNLPVDEFRRLGVKTIIRTSAEHNEGISQLLDSIAELIPPKTEKAEDDVLTIALIGRPNVGKSHLFNTLGKKQQAIVANVAGTTRDINRVRVHYNQRPIDILDTAGVRRQGKQEIGIEKFSVLRTLQAIESADICFLLMDVNELSTGLDQRLAGIIDEAGKGLVIVVSKWDSYEEKDDKTRDVLAKRIAYDFKFTPWAPLIFTSAVTGQNVSRLFELAIDIDSRRKQPTKTRVLNDLLQKAIVKHPPAGLKNTHPKLRYIVQTDDNPPWFVIHGSELTHVHWSYKRYLERLLRETYDYSGTPIKFSFRDEKQIKLNKERVAQGKDPITKAAKQTKNAQK